MLMPLKINNLQVDLAYLDSQLLKFLITDQKVIPKHVIIKDRDKHKTL